MPDYLGRGRIASMLTCGIRRSTSLQKQGGRGGRRGLRPWPLRCLSQILTEREREGNVLDRLVSAFKFAYLSPSGWLWIYKVYCSQFKVCKDSLLLEEIFLAFIELDIEGKRLPRIIPLSYFMRPDL